MPPERRWSVNLSFLFPLTDQRRSTGLKSALRGNSKQRDPFLLPSICCSVFVGNPSQHLMIEVNNDE